MQTTTIQQLLFKLATLLATTMAVYLNTQIFIFREKLFKRLLLGLIRTIIIAISRTLLTKIDIKLQKTYIIDSSRIIKNVKFIAKFTF